jgi:uncharacterized Ntn-hydrolase superfamily protein
VKFFFTVIIVLLPGVNLFATWSIIIIDPTTKEIGIAGASCTYNCYGIGEIIPGKGAIIVQAMSNTAARDKGLQMIISEYSPGQIIAALRGPFFDPERQQYAIVTLKDFSNPMTYTGDSTKYYRGALTTDGISVQGNTLTNENVLKEIFNAVLKGQNASLRIDQILMLALEAGAKAGGDKRCGEQKATSAFIAVAKPGDRQPYLKLVIFGQAKGGQNAVHMLRKKYERWSTRHIPDKN